MSAAAPSYFSKVVDPIKYRQASARMIWAVLEQSPRFQATSAATKNGIVIGIERGLLNASVQFLFDQNKVPIWELEEFNMLYLRKRHLLLASLEAAGGDVLDEILFKRHIPWARLAFMPVFYLRRDRFAHITNKIAERSAVVLEQKFATATNPCGRCGSKKIKIKLVQTRSSDEAAREVRICYGCDKTF